MIAVTIMTTNVSTTMMTTTESIIMVVAVTAASKSEFEPAVAPAWRRYFAFETSAMKSAT